MPPGSRAARQRFAVLPRVVGDQTADLRRLDLPAEPPSRDIWMGYHRDLKRLNRLRAFIAMVSEHVEAYRY